MSSTEKIEAQKLLINLAKQILSQRIDLATGVWALRRPLGTLKLNLDETFLIFESFASDTDHLPLPKHKKNWAPERYLEKVAELKDIENEYGPRIHAAFRTLPAELYL